MKNVTKGKVLKVTAIVVDVAAPFGATLSQFPVWVEKSSEATVSGLFLVCAFLSCIPFLRQINEYMKSPAAVVMWAVFFVLFAALRNIIDQMVIVCFIGLLANGIGAILYKVGNVVGEKPDKEDETTAEQTNMGGN